MIFGIKETRLFSLSSRRQGPILLKDRMLLSTKEKSFVQRHLQLW